MNDLDRVEDMSFRMAAFADYDGSVSPSSTERPSAYRFVSRQSGLAFRMPHPNVDLFAVNARRRRHLIAKRFFDVVASVLAILALLPLFAMVALLIKLTDRGPVFFRQEREGFGGVPFAAFKFRSMRLDDCDVTGVTQTVRNDPRVTKIGRLLRQTSIDELPQLFNVLLGQMSLVGPRPHVPGMMAAGVPYETLVPYYHRRLEMLPGITGWAQANGLRGSTYRADLAQARIDHDIAYIQNFSFWLDLKIIGRTISREFFGGSGY